MELNIAALIKENRNARENIISLEMTVRNLANTQIKNVDFANVCIALKGYRIVEEATAAILVNAGVLITDDNRYFSEIEENQPIFDENNTDNNERKSNETAE